MAVIEDACGVSSPRPHTTDRTCVSIGKIVAMISAVNSTCRAEAEPVAEDDAEAEAEAGGCFLSHQKDGGPAIFWQAAL